MPCALTQGYTLDCRDNTGGAKNIWLMEFENVSGIVSSAGVVTTIGKNTGKRFWKYEQELNVPEAKEEFTGSRENGTGFWKQTVAMAVNKMQASRRNEVALLVQNRLVAVIQDKNDRYFLYGEEEGLMIDAATAGTGKASGDRNGYTWNLAGEERYPAKEVSSAVVLTLETPG